MTTNLHVVPHESQWAVREEGVDRIASVHKTQQEAIHHAREIAHRAGVALIIHEKHGRITAREAALTKAIADQHVVPHADKWAVKAEGGAEPTSVHNTQAEAIQRAREIARQQGTILFIHAHDGHVREQHDYGE